MKAMPTFDDALTLEMYVEGQPVSVKAMYGSPDVNLQGTGQRHLTAQARAWRDAVSSETVYARLDAGEVSASVTTKQAPYHLPLKVACIFYGSRVDPDRLIKLTLEGLKEGLGIDDRHFAVVESGKAPAFMRNGRRFRGCWIGVWENVAAAPASETSGGAA